MRQQQNIFLRRPSGNLQWSTADTCAAFSEATSLGNDCCVPARVAARAHVGHPAAAESGTMLIFSSHGHLSGGWKGGGGWLQALAPTNPSVGGWSGFDVGDGGVSCVVQFAGPDMPLAFRVRRVVGALASADPPAAATIVSLVEGATVYDVAAAAAATAGDHPVANNADAAAVLGAACCCLRRPGRPGSIGPTGRISLDSRATITGYLSLDHLITSHQSCRASGFRACFCDYGAIWLVLTGRAKPSFSRQESGFGFQIDLFQNPSTTSRPALPTSHRKQGQVNQPPPPPHRPPPPPPSLTLPSPPPLPPPPPPTASVRDSL